VPDEDKTFGGSFVLDFRKWWRHVKMIYSEVREWRHKNLDPPQDSDKQTGMAKDLKLSSSAKATILTQNNGVPGCKFEGEPEDYTVE